MRFGSAFYRNTPYAKPVIGYENTIRRMKRSELFDYYERFYHPSNMTAIVIGDFQKQDILRSLEESYGSSLARSYDPPCRHTELTIEESSSVHTTVSLALRSFQSVFLHPHSATRLDRLFRSSPTFWSAPRTRGSMLL